MSVLYENSSQNLRLSKFPSEWENIFTLSKQVSLSRMRRNENAYRVSESFQTGNDFESARQETPGGS
jgi:hypothetical protein